MPDARPFLLLALLVPAQAAEITVNATRNGETFRVEASAEFEGSLARAWQVLTDYGRFAEFVPDLQVSRILSREGGSVLVEQKGAARLLFWSYPMDVRLAVTEHPYERVESRSVSGNFREMQNAYTLEARSGQVQLRYTGRMVPDFYVPPLIGTLALQHSIETTFRALVHEMERLPGDDSR
jgi:ribosome-associated toxin RatA of RatAB toxin-antitoxin module